MPDRTEQTSSANLLGANLERACDYNQRVTLQAIRVHGEMTRVELARLTGLTAPGIANIARRLIDEGLIHEVGRIAGRRGQPAKRLAVNPDGRFSIGISLARDHVTIVALDLAGKLRARASDEADCSSLERVAGFCRKSIDAMLKSRQIQRDRVIGIGVALPNDGSTFNRQANSRAWNPGDVSKALSNLLAVPICVESDCAAAALGELHYGRGLDESSFFYLLINASLGGGWVVNGNYFSSARGNDGVGSFPLRSRRASAKFLRDAVSLPSLYERLATKGHRASRPDHLRTLNASGQAILRDWIDDAAHFLTDPLIAVNCLGSPRAILIGGRLPANLIDRLADRLNTRLQRRAAGAASVAPVSRAALAVDASAMGAAILPISERLLPSHAVLMKT